MSAGPSATSAERLIRHREVGRAIGVLASGARIQSFDVDLTRRFSEFKFIRHS
jgi:hypothetical protein